MTNSLSNSDQRDAIRNLIIIIGITGLLVVSIILVGFIISRLNNTDDPGVIDTTELSEQNEDSEQVNLVTGEVLEEAERIIDSAIEENTDTEAISETNDEVIASSSEYKFTANSGDNYSWISRRAMYAYLTETDSFLNRAQRLFMEVTLANSFENPLLFVGQVVSFESRDVSKVFTEALGLSAIELRAWENQASYVNYQ